MVGKATYLSCTINTSGLWNYYCLISHLNTHYLGDILHILHIKIFIYTCLVPGVERANMQLRYPYVLVKVIITFLQCMLNNIGLVLHNQTWYFHHVITISMKPIGVCFASGSCLHSFLSLTCPLSFLAWF